MSLMQTEPARAVGNLYYGRFASQIRRFANILFISVCIKSMIL